jgi:hypothetical protein
MASALACSTSKWAAMRQDNHKLLRDEIILSADHSRQPVLPISGDGRYPIICVANAEIEIDHQ